MTEIPYFFFSYSNNNRDRYLDKFFEELEKRVGQISGTKGISFRDTADIKGGDDWNTKISGAAATSRTMVCIYSPFYFKSEFCGKEFTVFLDRQPRVERDAEGKARNSDKIVPILWERLHVLQRKDLPPIVARDIHHRIPVAKQYLDRYEGKGLRRLRVGGNRGAYAEILEIVAETVVEKAENDPLAPLHPPRTFDELANAFSGDPDVQDVSSLTSDIPLIIYLFAEALDPGFYQTKPQEHPGKRWRPHGKDNPDGLRASLWEVSSKLGFERVIDPVYDLTNLDAAAKSIISDLEFATTVNAPSIVLTDPWFVNDPGGRELVERVVAAKGWSGGLIVPRDEADARMLDLIPKVEDAWQVSDPERILVTEVQGTLDQFKASLHTILTKLQERIAFDPERKVPQKFEGRGRKTLPPLESPGHSRR